MKEKAEQNYRSNFYPVVLDCNVCLRKGCKLDFQGYRLRGSARLFSGCIFVILAFVVIFGFGEAPAQEFTMKTITPKFNWTFFMTMAWIMQAVGGGESIGVYIKDVKGGNKTFVKIMILYYYRCWIDVCIGRAVGLVVPAEVLSGNFSNGIFDVFRFWLLTLEFQTV